MASCWYPGRQVETEGRWACHLSLFYATERVPDAINVLQVHGHNVQYSESPGASPPPPSRPGRIRSHPGPGRAGTAFVVAAPAVVAHPEPPGALRPGRAKCAINHHRDLAERDLDGLQAYCLEIVRRVQQKMAKEKCCFCLARNQYPDL